LSFVYEGDQIVFSETLEFKGIDQELSNTIAKWWDLYSAHYQDKIEITTINIATMLYSLTHAS